MVKRLLEQGWIEIEGKRISLDEVSWVRKGDSVAIVIDTRFCQQAIDIARDARLLLCESTYLESERDLAWAHYHLTAKQAATIAKEANVQQLVLTHYSARYPFAQDFEREAREVFPNSSAAEDLKVFPFPRNTP